MQGRTGVLLQWACALPWIPALCSHLWNLRRTPLVNSSGAVKNNALVETVTDLPSVAGLVVAELAGRCY